MEKIVASLLLREGLSHPVEVSVLFADNETVRGLNQAYRGVDAPTDVLSFPQTEPGGPARPDGASEVLLGDVVICVDVAREQAREMRHSLKQESALLLAHGVLHLLGYGHDTPEDAERMRQAESAVLAGSAYLDRAK